MYASCPITSLSDTSTEVFIIIFESIKLKFTLRYDSVDTEGRRKYISNILATSVLEGGRPISNRPLPLYHCETSVTYFTGNI